MGLGAVDASDQHFLGMLGMHGTYEANMTMHDCDFMLNVGARFDDRVTGNLMHFSPNSVKVHADIDASSIDKVVKVDVGIVSDANAFLQALLAEMKAQSFAPDQKSLKGWWAKINEWRSRNCLKYTQKGDVIKPQHAIERLYQMTHGKDIYVTTEVGQHQMWAAQYFKFHEPNRWMTSGGLGTMGYGLPAAVGTQLAHPDLAGDRYFGRSLISDEYAGIIDNFAISSACENIHSE